MRILVLNGQGGDGTVALVADGSNGLELLRQAGQPGRGGATRLASLLRDMLATAGWEARSLGLIAAIIGPGSFTGLRATLALAHGIALGSGAPLQGVGGGEALRRTLGDASGTRSPGMKLWCATMARRDRVFIERPEHEGPEAFMLDEVPIPDYPVLLAGDAASLVAIRIRSAGGVAVASPVERPEPLAIAAIALDRLHGRLPPLAALPLYVDAPEAKRPAAGLRPLPA